MFKSKLTPAKLKLDLKKIIIMEMWLQKHAECKDPVHLGVALQNIP